MNHTIRSASFALCFLMLLAACKKQTKERDPETEDKETPDTETSVKHLLLPSKIVYGQLTTTFEYIPGSRRLKSISKSTGTSYHFRYKNDTLLYICEIVQGNNTVQENGIKRNAKLTPTAVTRFRLTGNVYSLLSQDKLTFNTAGRLTESEIYDAANTLTLHNAFTYLANGAIATITGKANAGSIQHSLTYDEKNSIFKNVSDGFLIYLLYGDLLFTAPTHNILSYHSTEKTDDNMMISYEYNAQNYPTKMVIKRAKWTETHYISYTSYPDK
ncbi:hypothetical protein [Pedobacter faecalis]|uniref:hypothetical protein n=1 Tax=Pedobacter faecalis TaxID=3041495 RepID=UPI00254C4D4B|nr:hypothetical protein [Pedobacter sp. ELA7]